ncbi:hypothetical protein BU17DRAFT_83473 [Hysterangium stoloniferum]|nr:hypothetical protein BU17DRAFT_83473 [Hysterangium stoloniferum]
MHTTLNIDFLAVFPELNPAEHAGLEVRMLETPDRLEELIAGARSSALLNLTMKSGCRYVKQQQARSRVSSRVSNTPLSEDYIAHKGPQVFAMIAVTSQRLHRPLQSPAPSRIYSLFDMPRLHLSRDEIEYPGSSGSSGSNSIRLALYLIVICLPLFLRLNETHFLADDINHFLTSTPLPRQLAMALATLSPMLSSNNVEPAFYRGARESGEDYSSSSDLRPPCTAYEQFMSCHVSSCQHSKEAI